MPAHKFAAQFSFCISSSVFFCFVGTAVVQRVRVFRFVFLSFCFVCVQRLWEILAAVTAFSGFFLCRVVGKFGNVLVAAVPV